MPLASVAMQVTVVWPIGKSEPDGGVQVTIGAGSASSVAVTEKATGTSRSTLHETAMSAGQEITGGVTSGGAALNTSAEARKMPESSATPPVSSTLPSESTVAEELFRPVLMLAVGDQVPKAES